MNRWNANNARRKKKRRSVLKICAQEQLPLKSMPVAFWTGASKSRVCDFSAMTMSPLAKKSIQFRDLSAKRLIGDTGRSRAEKLRSLD
jgi:hypothetical protein